VIVVEHEAAAVEGPKRQLPLLFLIAALVVLLSVPAVVALVSSDRFATHTSAPPGDERWGSEVGEPEELVAQDEIWSASAGVWHWDDGYWIRNGNVPAQGLALSPDGTMWLHTNAQVLSDKVDESGLLSEIRKVLIHDDGQVWACGEGLLLHYDGLEWTSSPMPIERGVMGCELAVTADGTVWIGTFNAWDPTVGNLASFDGEEWTVADPLGDGSQLPVVALSVGPDGYLWAVFVDFSRMGDSAEFQDWAMAAYDGELWTAYTDDLPERFPVSAVTTFEGAVWLGSEAEQGETGLVTFDGTDWLNHSDGIGPAPGRPDNGRTVWLAGPEPLLSVTPPAGG
jgi:hypothetical protein